MEAGTSIRQGLTALWALGVLAGVVVARTIVVEADGTGEYPTIQAAVDVAVDGDVVVLQAGVFAGDGNRDLDFKGKAIAIESEAPEDPNVVAETILYCTGEYNDPHRGAYFHSGEDSNSVLNGLTICRGLALYSGGAICCENSEPSILNCVIKNNVVLRPIGTGGGIACFDSSPKIYDCIISENTSTVGHAGGIYCSNSSPDIQRCIFDDNSAGFRRVSGDPRPYSKSHYGGAIFLVNNSKPAIKNCCFTKNIADGVGGAIACYSGSNPLIKGCLIYGNKCSDRGGSIACTSSTIDIECSTFINNTAGSAFGSINCWGRSIISISGCILWDNAGPEIWLEYFSTLSISYTDIDGGKDGIRAEDSIIGCYQENISLNPVLDTYLCLLPASPCIDAGDPNYIWDGNEVDLDGRARVIGGRVDMGAYEFVMLEADLRVTPGVLNRRAKGPKEVGAVICLGEADGGFDVSEGVTLYPGSVKAASCKAVRRGGAVCIAATFARDEVLAAIGANGGAAVEAVGRLETGEWFSGRTVVQIKE